MCRFEAAAHKAVPCETPFLKKVIDEPTDGVRSRSSSTMYSTPLSVRTRCRIRTTAGGSPSLRWQPTTSPGPYGAPYAAPLDSWNLVPSMSRYAYELVS